MHLDELVLKLVGALHGRHWTGFEEGQGGLVQGRPIDVQGEVIPEGLVGERTAGLGGYLQERRRRNSDRIRQ